MKLLTFLGIGSYSETEYVFGEQRWTSCYAPVASARFPQPTEVIVFATDNAQEAHGDALQQDPRLFEQLVDDFRLHKAAKGSPPRKAGDPFPRSKRVVMDKTNKPAAPLGWVSVECR